MQFQSQLLLLLLFAFVVIFTTSRLLPSGAVDTAVSAKQQQPSSAELRLSSEASAKLTLEQDEAKAPIQTSPILKASAEVTLEQDEAKAPIQTSPILEASAKASPMAIPKASAKQERSLEAAAKSLDSVIVKLEQQQRGRAEVLRVMASKQGTDFTLEQFEQQQRSRAEALRTTASKQDVGWDKAWYESNCQPFAIPMEKRDRPWYNNNVAVNDSGAWVFDSCWAVYYLDVGLANALSTHLKGRHVVEMGAGCGCYTSAIMSMREVLSIKAFDGVVGIGGLTNGLVEQKDLSRPDVVLPSHDWTVCMEVGEHVPAAAEDTFLDNVVQGAQQGVVLTWAPPGKGGHSHINERSNDYIIQKMAQRGFKYNGIASNQIRKKALKQMFKNSLMVFNTQARTGGTP